MNSNLVDLAQRKFSELNQLRTSVYMWDFASGQEQQKCEAKQKGEDDRRKGEEMRRAATMSMFQYRPLIRLISPIVIAMQVGALYQQ